MKRAWKKFAALFLSFAITATLLPSAAFAEGVIEPLAESPTYEYVKDTDGVDSGAVYEIFAIGSERLLYHAADSTATNQITGTVTGDKLTYADTEKYPIARVTWTIAGDAGNGYTIQNKSDSLYLNQTASGSQLAVTSTPSLFFIEGSTNGNYHIYWLVDEAVTSGLSDEEPAPQALEDSEDEEEPALQADEEPGDGAEPAPQAEGTKKYLSFSGSGWYASETPYELSLFKQTEVEVDAEAAVPVIPGYTQYTEAALDTTKYYLVVSQDSSGKLYALYANADGTSITPGALSAAGCGAKLTVSGNTVTAAALKGGSSVDMDKLNFIVSDSDSSYQFQSNECYLSIDSHMFETAEATIKLSVSNGEYTITNASGKRWLNLNVNGDAKSVYSNNITDFWGPTSASNCKFPIYLFTKDGASAPTELELAKKDLRAAITKAEALTEADYKAETWSALQTALASAKDVLDNESATLEQVNAALTELNSAVAGLLVKPTDPTESTSIVYEQCTEAIAAGDDVFAICADDNGTPRILYSAGTGSTTDQLGGTISEKYLSLNTDSRYTTNSQLWKVVAMDNGEYALQSQESKRYLDLTSSTAQDGKINVSTTPVALTITPSGDGTYTISKGSVFVSFGTKYYASATAASLRIFKRTEKNAEVLDNTPPASGTTTGAPFPAGAGGSQNFRIPSLITLTDGTLVAAIDARWNHLGDACALDTILSVSTDNGKTWNYSFPNYFNDSTDAKHLYATAFIDPVMVQSKKTGEIYLMVDLFPGGVALNTAQIRPDAATGYVNINGKQRLVLYPTAIGQSNPYGTQTDDNYSYYVGDFSGGYAPVLDKTGANSGYFVDAYYYLYTGDNKTPIYCEQLGGSNTWVQQNVFFYNADLHVRKASYLWIVKSSDDGETWSEPIMINDQVRTGNDIFYGVGPGAGLCFTDGKGQEVILLPTYTHSTEHAGFIYSADGGVTWERAGNSTTSDWSSESCLVQIDENTVRHFYRDGYSTLRYTDHTWDGFTFTAGTPVDTGVHKTYSNQLSAIRYSTEIDGKPAILLSTAAGSGNSRTNGKIYVLLINDDKTLTKAYEYEVTAPGVDYAYSSITELKDGSIGLLYEGANSKSVYVNIPISDITADPLELPGYTRITQAEALEEGETYIIVSKDSSNQLYAFYPDSAAVSLETGDAISAGMTKVAAQLTINGSTVTAVQVDGGNVDLSSLGFTLTPNGSDYEVKFANDLYLALANDGMLSASVTPLTITDEDGVFTIRSDSANRVLDFNKEGDPNQFVSSSGATYTTNFWGPRSTKFPVYLYVDNATRKSVREKLQAEVNTGEALQESDYTAESWQPYAAALADAKTLLANSNSTDEAMTQALNDLRQRKSSLAAKSSIKEVEDLIPKPGTTQDRPFASGTGGSDIFRIPSLITLTTGEHAGRILAAIDARWNHAGDACALDTILSYSDDNGKTWHYSFPNYFGDSTDAKHLDATAFIDPVMVEGKDGTIYLMVDLFPGGVAINTAPNPPERASGYVDINGTQRLALYTMESGQTDSNYSYYVGDFSNGYAPVLDKTTHAATQYSVDEHYYLYTGADKAPIYCEQLGSNALVQQNVFFCNADLHVRRATYLWLISSKDGGETWSAPTILNPQIRTGAHQFYGVGPGAGLCMDNGTLILPCYTFQSGGANNSAQIASFVYSTDNGKTWTRSQDSTSGGHWSSESCLVQIDENTVRHFYRDGYSTLYYTDHTWDGSKFTAGTPVDTGVHKTYNNQLSAIRYSTEIDGKPAILLSTAAGSGNSRTNGKIYVLLLNDDKTLAKAYEYEVTASGAAYGYSSITELKDGSIGLLYEGVSNESVYRSIPIGDIVDGGLVGSKRQLMVPLYGTKSDTLETTPTAAELASLDSTIVSVAVNGTTVTYTGLKEGTTSFTSGGIEHTIKVAPETLETLSVEAGKTVRLNLAAGTTIAHEPDSSIATAEIITEQLDLAATGCYGWLGTDQTYSGEDVLLSNALYTFTQSGNNYQISAQTANGTKVYLKLGSPGHPNSTSSADIRVSDAGNGNVYLYDVTADRHLYFWRDGRNTFDQNGGADATSCPFQLYRRMEAGETSSTAIPGYVKVSEAADGGKYLIVAECSGTYFALYPSTDTSSTYSNVIKVNPDEARYALSITGVASGTTDIMVNGIIYRVTVADRIPETLDVTATGYTGVYDGRPHSITVTAEAGAVITYSADGTEYSSVNPTFTNAGTYTVYYRAVKDGYQTAEGTQTVQINKATPTVTITPSVESLSGGGTVTLTVTGTGLPEDGTLSVTCDGDAYNPTRNEDGTYSVSLPNSTATYTFTVRYNGSENYSEASAACSVSVTYYSSDDSGSSSSGVSGSGSGTKLPVSTGDKQEEGVVTTETTATPTATVRGDTATTTISRTIAQEIVSQAEKNDSQEVVIAPIIQRDVTKTTVSLPASTVGDLAKRTNASLKIETSVASVTIPNDGLGELAGKQGNVAVTAERTGSVVELSITSNGEAVETISGGITLVVPQDDCTLSTVAVLVHEDGTREVVRKSMANDSALTVTIPLNGSARLEIVNNSKAFDDVKPSDWHKAAVEFVSSHELFHGTSETTFVPDVEMTRGMLAVVLHNLEGNPSYSFSGGFPDVGSTWYTDAVQWAANQGIVTGYADGSFGPDDPITREQMAVMLWRYAGSPTADTHTLNFNDAGAVSDWASKAMCWAVENSIINGMGNGILNPGGQATRAQVAQMLLNFMQSGS